MTELKVLKETVEFMGFELPVIEGGFGEGQRILTEIQVAKIHNMEIYEVRKSIKRLIEKDRLKSNIDYIDLKGGSKEFTTSIVELLVSLGYTKSGVTQASNIYILSERGYTKLVKAMDDDESWDVMDKIVDGYFKYRKMSIASYMIDDPIKRAEKWIEEQKQTKLLLEQKDNKIETQHKLIDTITQSYDGTYIRMICVDYVNKISKQTGIHQSDLYSKVYKLVGRALKKDLTIQFENFTNNEKLKVKENIEYNRENKLKGLDRKSPYLIKDSKANISKVEFVCDVLGQGNIMLEAMSKVFEVGIEDIIEKYNIVKIEKELSGE